MNEFKILLLIFLSIISCNEKSNKPDTIEIEMETEFNTSKNYLALGDSYTIGESVSEKDRFPMLLINELNTNNYLFNSPKIIAKTGWTTDELKDAILKENIAKQYNLVTLLIGVNNQYRGNSIDEFRVEFAELLNMAISFAGNNIENVIVVSIPDWAVSPFAENRDRAKISEQIDIFNAVKKEETLKRNIKFVDITAISRQALGKSEYFANDGLHFSGLMHQLWVDEIMNAFLNKN